MTTEHDYATSLAWLDDALGNVLSGWEEDPAAMEAVPAIRHALKLAQKVTGEPSKEMIRCVSDMYFIKAPHTGYIKDKFKAMITQAQKEIGE